MASENEPTVRIRALSAVERYHILRDQLQHEDNLTTQRLSWLMASQAFLFTAYAIVMNGPEHAMNQFAQQQRHWLMTAIPALALSSAALIYISIIAGVTAMVDIHRHAGRICDGDSTDPEFPPIQGALFTRVTGLASPMLVPPIFIGVWFYLMFKALSI
jgi:hypothetical protein